MTRMVACGEMRWQYGCRFPPPSHLGVGARWVVKSFFVIRLLYSCSCSNVGSCVVLTLSQVSDFMLSMESAELNVTFFAAQTIHAKIQNNFRELPQERCACLRHPVWPLLVPHGSSFAAGAGGGAAAA